MDEYRYGQRIEASNWTTVELKYRKSKQDGHDGWLLIGLQ